MKNSEIFGYILYSLHLLFTCLLNLGWLFITKIFHLHILLFSQTITILSWNVFDGKCIITIIENWLLKPNNIDDSSITIKFLSEYLSKNIVNHIFVFTLFVALLFTLIKKLYVNRIKT
jgi:hypothetical protein